MAEKGKKTAVRRILFFIPVVLLLIAGILIVLIEFDLLSAPSFLRGLIPFREKSSAEQDGDPTGIPDIHVFDEELTEFFYDIDPAKLLGTLSVRDSFTYAIRVIKSFNSDYTIERISIAKKGNNWRADSDSRQIIWNGEKLYVREEPNAWYFTTGSFDFFEEIGITPLDEIRRTAAQMGGEYRLSDDGKKLNVIISDKESGIHSEYEIAVETGVVLSESSYYRNTPFRTVVTDSLNLFGADSLPDDYFNIP